MVATTRSMIEFTTGVHTRVRPLKRPGFMNRLRLHTDARRRAA